MNVVRFIVSEGARAVVLGSIERFHREDGIEYAPEFINVLLDIQEQLSSGTQPNMFMKCDGDHKMPACRDALCWHRSPLTPPEPKDNGLYRCNQCMWTFFHDVRGWSQAVIDETGRPMTSSPTYFTWDDWTQQYGDCVNNIRHLA